MKELKNNFTKRDEVSCVILAGGEGRRLDGKGKYSKIFNCKTLLEHVYTRMLKQTSHVAVNFRNENYKVNQNYFVVTDKFNENIGPLAGIHAAISYSKERFSSVVTVPVDTPFIPLDLITKLNSNFNPMAYVKFTDMFPVSLTTLEFSAQENDYTYFTASVTFKYLLYEILDTKFKVRTTSLTSKST